MTDQQEREAFEAWYEGNALPGEADWFRLDSMGEYQWSDTAACWEGWQARAALAATPAPAEPAPVRVHQLLAALTTNDDAHARARFAIELRALYAAATPAQARAFGSNTLDARLREQEAREIAGRFDTRAALEKALKDRATPAQTQQAGWLKADIIRAAVAAMPHTNPGVADDLLHGDTMHTEADDVVAIFCAGMRAATKAEAKPLTDEQALSLWKDAHWKFETNALAFARAIERAHGIGASTGGGNG